MPRSDEKRMIDEARKSFDAVLHTPEFNQVHADDAQLNLLLDYLAITPGGNYLDLATGNGYAAFAIARRQPDCQVTGIDVAGAAIEKNVNLARKNRLGNVSFALTDGISLDFPVAAFDGIVCRYALHHLPDLRATLGDANKVLKDNGRLVIADAVLDEADDRDFINRFQALQPDGHVRIYPRDGLLALIDACGFRPLDLAMTSISYAQQLNSDYRKLIDGTPPAILEAYGIAVQGDAVSARLNILNAAFTKA